MCLLILTFHLSIVIFGLILLGMKRENDRRAKQLKVAIYLLSRGRL